MLYGIVIAIKNSNRRIEEFEDMLSALGETQFAFNNFYLLETVLTAVGIEKKLQPFIESQDRFFILSISKGGCAGNLTAKSKKFYLHHINPYHCSQEKVLDLEGYPILPPPRSACRHSFLED